MVPNEELLLSDDGQAGAVCCCCCGWERTPKAEGVPKTDVGAAGAGLFRKTEVDAGTDKAGAG